MQEKKSRSPSEDLGYPVDSVSESSSVLANDDKDGSGECPQVDDVGAENKEDDRSTFYRAIATVGGTKSPLSNVSSRDGARSEKAASKSTSPCLDADSTPDGLPALPKELMARVENLEQQLSDHQRKLDHRVEQFENRIAGVVASLRAEFETDLRPKCRAAEGLAKSLSHVATLEGRLSTLERLVQTSGLDSPSVQSKERKKLSRFY